MEDQCHFRVALGFIALLVVVVAIPGPQPKAPAPTSSVVVETKSETAIATPIKAAAVAPLNLPVESVPVALAKAVELGRKALPSASDQTDLHRAWATPALIDHAVSKLLDVSAKARTEQAQKERMAFIDYLDGALLWTENPRRQEVIESMLKVLERDVAQLDATVELRRSLAGDVIELYGVLLQGDAERAQDLYGRVSPEQQRLFRFAKSLVITGRHGQTRRG